MDDLRKLAEAAHQGAEWRLCAESAEDIEYMAAASPERILRLLDVVDKAKALLPGLGFYVDPRVTALSTALDALEKDQ